MKDYTTEKQSISVMRTTRGKRTERWTGADSSVLRSIVNILPGVTIGENAIIGTGSIVTQAMLCVLQQAFLTLRLFFPV